MTGSRRDPTDPGADIARPENQSDTEPITCHECTKQIPGSAARTVEGEDYIRHFCGLECFNRWQHRRSPGEDPEPGK